MSSKMRGSGSFACNRSKQQRQKERREIGEQAKSGDVHKDSLSVID